MSRSKTFKARYAGGICPLCGAEMREGELQLYIYPHTPNEVRIHSRCVRRQLDEQQELPVTPRARVLAELRLTCSLCDWELYLPGHENPARPANEHEQSHEQ